MDIKQIRILCLELRNEYLKCIITEYEIFWSCIQKCKLEQFGFL